jgi:serine/threonine-protein kinase
MDRDPLLERATLERVQADPRFTFEDRAAVIDRIARAIEEIHASSVIHCDIKPSNVFLTSGDGVKIFDFGASLFEHEGARPAEDWFHGTHRYAAPERIAAQPFDRRSDVFSLGVLVFEVLTGQLPWDAGTVPALLVAMCRTPPKSFRRAALARSFSIPRAMIDSLSDIVDRTLARDPNERFPSISAFLDAWRSCTAKRAA